jgi:hypothetical protein
LEETERNQIIKILSETRWRIEGKDGPQRSWVSTRHLKISPKEIKAEKGKRILWSIEEREHGSLLDRFGMKAS